MAIEIVGIHTVILKIDLKIDDMSLLRGFAKLLMRSVRKKILCGSFPMKKKMVKF